MSWLAFFLLILSLLIHPSLNFDLSTSFIGKVLSIARPVDQQSSISNTNTSTPHTTTPIPTTTTTTTTTANNHDRSIRNTSSLSIPLSAYQNVSTRTTGKKAVIITFVNGIYHSEEDWRNITDDIRQLFSAEVRPFYNPSSGWWVKDFTRAGFDLVLRPTDLALSKQLAEHLRQTLQDLEPGGRILHIAHSGGAILTYLAAKHHLTSYETSRIDIITLGGGKSITNKYFMGRVFNYYARNDPLALIDQRANALMRRTQNETYDEIRDKKHNTTFVFLAPQANNPIWDHSMMGPTYRYAMMLEAKAMKDRLRRFFALQQRDRDLVRLARKRVAKMTGMHHFWDWQVYGTSSSLLRRMRKSAAQWTRRHGYFSGKYAEQQNNSVMFDEGALFGNGEMAMVSPTKSYQLDELQFDLSR